MTFEFFVHDGEGNLFTELRIFVAQHILRFGHHEVAPRSAGDAPEHEHVGEFVELGEMRQRITKVNAQRFVNRNRPFLSPRGRFTGTSRAIPRQRR